MGHFPWHVKLPEGINEGISIASKHRRKLGVFLLHRITCANCRFMNFVTPEQSRMTYRDHIP